MTVKKSITQMYSDFCAKLGDLTIKRDAIQSDIDTIKAQLDAIQTLLPELQKIDTAVAAERAALSKVAQNVGKEETQ